MRHGGEIYGGERIQYDFSVNINPLGIPETVKKSLMESMEQLQCYPDPECRRLREALAEFTGVPAENTICGNGASELIEAAVRAVSPRDILLTAPSFSGYQHAAGGYQHAADGYRHGSGGAGAVVRWHVLRREEKFALTERYLEDLARCPDMAILCNPANPVGNVIDPKLLERIIEFCAEKGIWLMIDECFLGFVRGEKERTARRYLEKYDRLLVLDAFTKRFAMPGIRLGYLMASDPAFLRRVKAQQPEWSVSVPAQIAGVAALEAGKAYMEKARVLVAAEHEKMVTALLRMGFEVYPGEANYIFFSDSAAGTDLRAAQTDSAAGTDLRAALLERGFLIRSCDNYPGLRKGDYRVAVLGPRENDALLEAIAQIRQ